MNAAGAVSALALVGALVTGCAGRPVTTTPSAQSTQRSSVPTGASPTTQSTVSGAASTATIDDARALAVAWVAATGELLKLGPIGRSEFLRRRVASASLDAMENDLAADLNKMADRLPVPATELRLIETPITINISIDPATGNARAQVWSVVVFGAKDLGAPRWCSAPANSCWSSKPANGSSPRSPPTEGPTPVATDALPAGWDSFAVVAGMASGHGRGALMFPIGNPFDDLWNFVTAPFEGFVGWAGDKIFEGITNWIAKGCVQLLGFVWAVMDRTASPHLDAAWFSGTATSPYQVAARIGGLVLLGVFFVAIAHGVATGDVGGYCAERSPICR